MNKYLKQIRWFVILLFCEQVITLSAQAASFDCSKASTMVEKNICSNHELSVLDEILNAAYHRTLVTSVNEQDIKRSQQTWLNERNACFDSECLTRVYEERIEWLTKQQRVPMQYKLVMSKNDAVCQQALDSYNKHVFEEFPLPPANFIRLYEDYPKHPPDGISPKWREGLSHGETWLTEIDLDWDGKAETILKSWALEGGDKYEKRLSSLDVMREIIQVTNTNFSALSNEIESMFPQQTRRLNYEKALPSGSFAKQENDKAYIPSMGIEGIEADQFDVVLLQGNAYLTYVSNDMSEDFFEDWSWRKWRVISRYRPIAGLADSSSEQDKLKDVCYLVLIRSLANK